MGVATAFVAAVIATAPSAMRNIALAKLPEAQPIQLDLRRLEPAPAPPPPPKREPDKRLIDAGAPTDEPVADTDLISNRASRAQDMSDAQGDPNRAAAYLESFLASQRYPDMPTLTAELAAYYAAAGNYPKARDSYEQVMARLGDLQGLGDLSKERISIIDSREKDQVARAREMGVTDPDRKYGLEDMAGGEVMFAATGVTTGAMLRGVRRFSGGAITHSIVMRSKSGTVRYVEGHHNFATKPRAFVA